MKILKVFLLILLSLFLAIFSLLFMINVGLERTVLNIDHYRNVTEEFNIFTQIQENIEEDMVPEEVDVDEMEEEEKEMFEVLREVFEPQWLQEQTLMVLEDVLTYTKGEREQLTATIDFSERKVVLEEKIAETIVAQEGLPLQEAQEKAEEIAEDIELPESIVLSEMIPDEVEGILDTVILFRTYSITASIGILVLLLIFILLLGGLSGGLKWFGTSMIIPAIVLLVVLFGFNSSLNIHFARRFVDIPDGFTFAIDVVRYTIRQLYLVPIVYLASGTLLVVLGSIFGKKKKEEEKPDTQGEITNEGVSTEDIEKVENNS